MARVKNGLISATPAIVTAQLLGVATVTLMLVWVLHFRGGLALSSVDKQRIFNVHPLLMVLGLIYCGGQAIMSYKMVPGSRRSQKLAHLLIHLVALILGSLGLYAVFKFHHDLNIPNMYTLHSWLGIITISLFAIQENIDTEACGEEGIHTFTDIAISPEFVQVQMEDKGHNVMAKEPADPASYVDRLKKNVRRQHEDPYFDIEMSTKKK